MTTCHHQTVFEESWDMSPDSSGMSPDSSDRSPDPPDALTVSYSRVAVWLRAWTVGGRMVGIGCEGFGGGPEDGAFTSVGWIKVGSAAGTRERSGDEIAGAKGTLGWGIWGIVTGGPIESETSWPQTFRNCCAMFHNFDNSGRGLGFTLLVEDTQQVTFTSEYLPLVQSFWAHSTWRGSTQAPWPCSCNNLEFVWPDHGSQRLLFPGGCYSYRNSSLLEGQEQGRCIRGGRWASTYLLEPGYCQLQSPKLAETEPLR